jgi:thiosulfate reductase cytochrome b subunit
MPDTAPTTVYRHRVATRVWHWVNAVAIVVLLGSGLMIFNAHPRLYWGQYGANFDAAWLTLPRFPGWVTIPASYDLAMGRRWRWCWGSGCWRIWSPACSTGTSAAT